MQSPAVQNLNGAEEGLPPEAVLTVQLVGDLARVRSSAPEKRLLLAVLEDAIRTLRKYAGASTLRGRRRFAEAQAWFATQEESESPFCFANVCYALGLDEHYVRRGLLQSRERPPRHAGAPRIRAIPDAA